MSTPLDPGDVLPAGPEGQSCAFCGGEVVAWVHPLDQTLVRFRISGAEHTLPHFWTTCDHCERLYLAGEVETVVGLMTAAGEWPDADVDDQVRLPLAVFARADLGARRLPR